MFNGNYMGLYSSATVCQRGSLTYQVKLLPVDTTKIVALQIMDSYI